jgi:signal transduction histidine kinase
LQDTISTLDRAMSELVQAEKLASLGSMVAGISHELNTPIGNALTVSSTLQERFETLATQVAGGKMTRSGLGEFVASGLEMSRLVVSATQRAAELISSFKQMAVDQTSAQRRSFDLHQVVDGILVALGTGLDRPGIRIHNSIAPGLLFDSYPGPLGQVLANLVQNALLHGFAEGQGGTITLAAELHDGVCRLSVTDDGVGMTPQVLARAFDPFFTTRLGRGGSGLGLAVCHRIATSVLGGELSVTSSPGQGACFVLVLPAQAPHKF